MAGDKRTESPAGKNYFTSKRESAKFVFTSIEEVIKSIAP
jgi:hypothetical protein